ncbi:type VI secretion system baseplate subunit TssE [Caballeronia sp. BR00000012568055]|uniref:type VI secretion system baseplate subunit TssE n=1 Tax=Caballeronia sp. BR00000012568055 TaxID=2918761 RepID=UPI0023F7C63C|nr:type VI secretion system baseplate subunit TssE [Caballeronia sp. BR00000012568055]
MVRSLAQKASRSGAAVFIGETKDMSDSGRGVRLLPSLLDRLTDEHPQRASEPLDARFMSGDDLRASVLRELRWIFNSVGQASGIDAKRHPHVSDSVLNYGLPSIVGHYAASVDFDRLQSAMRRAIVRFEPRILPASIVIEPASGRSKPESLNQIALVIRALLWFRPAPLEVVMRTQIDLENGGVTVDTPGA